MINSNPETVSTDFDTSDRLYFESLDPESVAEVLRHEGLAVRRTFRSSCSSEGRPRSTWPSR